MRGRIDQSRVKLWVLMEANRWVIAGALLAGVFLTLVALGVADPSPLQQAVAQSDPVETLFQGFVGAIITGVTLVVTLNQLVLSQELGPVGDQRGRMQGAMEFRRDVEDVLETDTSPPEPSSFLSALVDVTKVRADDLRETVEAARDEELKSKVDDYVEDLTRNAESVSDRLDDAQFGTFGVLSAALNFNYSWKIFSARRIRNDHADALTDEAEDAFDDVVEVLKFFAPAREHFKTLYFQWELVNLSRAMLYSSVPALVLAAAMILYYDARAVPGATLGVSNDVLVASFATTVAVSPFMILLSFVLRIATVAKRTLAIGPFILRETDREEDIDWE
ncbi:hypothetical protein NGM10_11030 [Halorussus salilacus]|nr:hypothetical protein [Halorussus salilacus]USZ69673.1 hypothetical protein NGM10_11030 [Halorussus salilacus]